MMNYLLLLPFLQSDDPVVNIITLAVIAILVLAVLRFLLRLASKVIAFGCSLLLLAGAGLLVYYLFF